MLQLDPRGCILFTKEVSSMGKRYKLSSGHSKRMFTRNAVKVHRRNLVSSNPMRGGIRL